MKYTSKADLVDDIAGEFAALTARLEAVGRERWKEPGVWGDDWTVHDLVAHLSAWHHLLLGWHTTGLRGETPDLPAPGYNWSETPRLNRDIQAEHADRPIREVRAELDATHGQVLALARALSEPQLLEPGHFPWTGKNGLVTYLGANTASHYRFALKVLKRWERTR